MFAILFSLAVHDHIRDGGDFVSRGVDYEDGPPQLGPQKSCTNAIILQSA